jgi:Zn-dependent protease
MSYLQDPLIFLIYILSLILAITIHEFSHGLIADYLGDPTPRIMKRLTLNPLAHLDPLGIILPIFLIMSGSPIIFGWGKPIPIDPFNLKNPRRDETLISLAGPLSNLVLALIASIILRLLFIFGNKLTIALGGSFLVILINLNLILAIFNLIPIYPLDGFKIVAGILPKDQAYEWLELRRYGWIFLLALIFPFGNQSLLSLIIRPIFQFLQSLLIPSIGKLI